MNKWVDRIVWITFGVIGFMSLLTVLSERMAEAGGFERVLWTIAILIGFFAMLSWAFRFSFFPRLFGAVVSALASFFRFLFFAGRRWEGARYMGFIEGLWFFRSSNGGFLVDGKSKRLSEEISYQSVLTVGGMGKGKSSCFVIPNLYTLDNRSIVVTDTSGEIFEQTSGHLKKKGFDLQTFNLMDMSKSLGFNPLLSANSFSEIQQLAHVLIKSSPALGGKDDPFWSAGAEKILRIFIQCLKNKGDVKSRNLAGLKRLINHFDAHTARAGESATDCFVMEATIDDPNTWDEYKGFTSGNAKTMTSFLTTADTALTAIGNPDLAKLTSGSGIDFSSLRKRKTALFVMVRQQDLSVYSFLLNLFYTDLFRHLLSDLNSAKRGLPVYMLLDEFGHLTIPDFAIFATTARKYRVAFWIFLQSLSQLESRYGRDEARTILDGLQTEIYLSGLGIETAEILSRRAGRRRRRDDGRRWQYGDEGLLNPDEIISMDDDEALLFYSNKRPHRYRITPFYRGWGVR